MALLFQAAKVFVSRSHSEFHSSIINDDGNACTTTNEQITSPTNSFHIIDLKRHETDSFAKYLPRYAVEFCDLLCLQSDFLYLIFHLFPEQLVAPDPNDHNRLPLHKAAAWTQVQFRRPISQQHVHKISVRQSGCTNNAVLEELLRVCPHAAKVRDRDGRLPLYLAIETGKE